MYQSINDYQYAFLPYVVSGNIEKSQTSFKSKTSTDSTNFSPHLREKHNAKEPYEEKCNFFKCI